MANQDTHDNDPHKKATPDQGASQNHQIATNPSPHSSIHQQTSTTGSNTVFGAEILSSLAIRFPALDMTTRRSIALMHTMYTHQAQKLANEANEMENELEPIADSHIIASGDPLMLTLELPKSRATVAILRRTHAFCAERAKFIEQESVEAIEYVLWVDEEEDRCLKLFYDHCPEMQEMVANKPAQLTIWERLLRMKVELRQIVRDRRAVARDMEELDGALAGVRIGEAEGFAQTIAGLMGGLSL